MTCNCVYDKKRDRIINPCPTHADMAKRLVALSQVNCPHNCENCKEIERNARLVDVAKRAEYGDESAG